MVSLSSPSAVEPAGANSSGRAAGETAGDDVLLIAGPGDAVIADFAAFVGRHGTRNVVVFSTADVCWRVGGRAAALPIEGFSRAALSTAGGGRRVSAAVLFIGRGLTASEQAALDAVTAAVIEDKIERVCVVSSFLAGLSDRAAAAAEARVLGRLKGSGARTVLFRPGHVLSPGSRASASLRALWFCHPLVPRRFRNCFLAGDELFAALLLELTGPPPRPGATYTLLGPNRAWRDVLRDHADRNPARRGLAAAATALSWLGVGWLAGLLFSACARLLGRHRRWTFDTLGPSSMQELLAVYNKYNYPHVKVVGYNNGAVHFGQKHPGKTVVSTARCDARATVRGEIAEFDAGVTVRRATEVLAAAGKELCVLPNYSYVCLGTSFFVPIHGSASDFSTLGDTITKVLLYDPVADRFVRADRGDPGFAEHAYNLTSPALLLRLSLRVKDKSDYFMERSRLEGPAGAEVLAILQDDRPANVELRKMRAADRAVDVCRYYTRVPQGDAGGALPFPRDSIGRLWDRLEANPVSSFLFHGFARRFLYHVELFVPPEEFATFWETHSVLPLMKMQFRYIKRDGLPHSPFQRTDCVSVDVLMWKKHKPAFDAYVKEKLHAVQFNPGKHSM
jgi:hypothetical protein